MKSRDEPKHTQGEKPVTFRRAVIKEGSLVWGHVIVSGSWDQLGTSFATTQEQKI